MHVPPSLVAAGMVGLVQEHRDVLTDGTQVNRQDEACHGSRGQKKELIIQNTLTLPL